MIEHKNTILAIVLSLHRAGRLAVFHRLPQMERQQQEAQLKQQEQTQLQHAAAAARRSGHRRNGRALPHAASCRPAPRNRDRAQAAIRLSRHLRALPIETPRLSGSIALKGGAHRRPRARAIPRDGRSQLAARSCCSRRRAAPHPFYAEFGWVPAAGATAKMPGRRHGLDAGGQRRARRRQAGHADLRQWRGPAFPPHHLGRRPLSVHRQGRGRNKGSAPVTLFPYALISRHGTPQTLGLLHPARGPDRRARRPGPAGADLQEDRGQEGARSSGRHQRLARHHRQILGGDACCPTPTPASRRASPPARPAASKTYQTDYLLDAQTDRAGRDRHGQHAAVRRRQGSVVGIDSDRASGYNRRSISTTSTC